jgi:hypothetical protein
MNSNWKYAGTAIENKEFKIDGINVWDYQWQMIDKKVAVKDPQYGNLYSFSIYEIKVNDLKIYFVAGEFSNMVWGFYTQT